MHTRIVVLTLSLPVCFLLFLGHCSGQDGSSSSNENEFAVQFEEKIRPLLEKYCIECHAPGDMRGLDFLAPKVVLDSAGHRGLYASVMQQLEDRSMPPKDFDQPSDEERKLVTKWIKTKLDIQPSDTDRIAQYVVEMYQDKQGSLWFGTMNKGVARYDGQQLTYFSTKDGLPSNSVSSFAEDGEGNLWAGTHAGVCKFDGKVFAKVNIGEPLNAGQKRSPLAWASVTTDRKGGVWASAGRKAFRFDGQSFNEFKVPIVNQEIASFAIVAGRVSLKMQDRKGNLWFGTDGAGAFKFDGKAFTQFTKKDGLCSNNVTSIMEDKQGRIWFTCIQSYQPRMTGDGGVCRYDGETFTRFPKIKGLSENDVYTIYETNVGHIWIGATGVGVYRYDGNSFTLFNQTDRQHWTRNFGLQSMLEDQSGTLWFGFSGGLFRFNGKSFFNIDKRGPWQSLISKMADIVAGEAGETSWIPAETNLALSALSKGKVDQAETILAALKNREPNEPTVQERMINQAGYELIFTNRLDLAIEVFRLNTRLHPTVANTFDSLAEAYLRKGNEPLAVKNYKKSLELDPDNEGAKVALRKIDARQRYEQVLVAPRDWLEEVLVVPPSFAPTMTFKGMEHLRLPASFRDPNSDWFLSYLFAIELSEATELTEEIVGEQLLVYFRGLADGGSDQNGNRIDTDKFSIEPQRLKVGQLDGEYIYTLSWREPFVNATPLKQNLRVKVIKGQNEHGVVFICGSPQKLESAVWKELLRIRTAFESNVATKESKPDEKNR